jgi:hypothetical protein
MDNNHNNGPIPPPGVPPGWVFYPYPPLVVYPPLQAPQTAQTSQALTLRAPSPPTPPPDPEPEPKPKPEENLPLALPASIKFVACHHCGVCGRPRSHHYHKEHPLIPGQVAPSGTCRKCVKKQDRGEPIDSVMLSLSMRSHATEKEASTQFYDPPSSEPIRGRLRSVSWRHITPRGISRPRIESIDGYTNEPSETGPPPPAPSVPRSSRSDRPLSDKLLSDKPPSGQMSRAQSTQVSVPPNNRVSDPPSDKISRATSSAGSSQRTAHSGYVSQTLPRREPRREIRETIEVRTRRPPRPSPAPETRETRSIIKASSKSLYRTPTPDAQGEARRTHDHYHVRFEHSPSRQQHALVRRDEQSIAPFYRHVERRTEETAPEETAKSTYHTYKRREEFEEEEVDTRLRLRRSGSKSGLRRQKSTSFNRFVLGLFHMCPPGYQN